MIRGEMIRDVLWLTPLGEVMTDDDWHKHYTRCLGMRLEGMMDDEIDEKGRQITGDTLLILFNSHNEPIPFLLPTHSPHEYWQTLLDTSTEDILQRIHANEPYPLQGHSLVVLKLMASRRERSKRST